MSMTGIDVFDTTVQKTNEWLNEIAQELGIESRQEAYQALRATLHTLRDRLPVAENAHLGDQLPMLIRGLYYEGWSPGPDVPKWRHDEFLAAVLLRLARTAFENKDPEPLVRAVFHTIARNIAPGEVEKIVHVLPQDLKPLWKPAAGKNTRAQAAT